MKRLLSTLVAAALVCPLALPPAHAAGPNNSATSAILADGETGRVLYEKNVNEKRLIASITKLMTALVAAESTPDLGELVTVERADTLAEGSSMYLREGEEVSLETLLYGLLLSSGNDAALTIARHCAGDVETFAQWMNERAESLDMKNTHFVNPNGLNDENHYSTAADMAKLAIEVMKNETLAKIVGTKSITLGKRTLTNHNKLLWQYEGCVGMKTGYTQMAGRTLVSCARRDGQLLIAVTLNDPNDWADHAALFDYGFRTYPRHVLATAGKVFRTLPVDGGLVRFVDVETATDVYFPTGEGEKLTAKVRLPERVDAPIEQGTIAGSLVFYLNEKQVGETYLLYSSTVNRDIIPVASLFQRVLDFFSNGDKKTMLTTFYPNIVKASEGAARAAPSCAQPRPQLQWGGYTYIWGSLTLRRFANRRCSVDIRY